MIDIVKSYLEGALTRMRQSLAGDSPHAEGFWVKGGSLVYVDAGHVHEVARVIQEHRDQEARLDILRAMMRR